MFRLPLSIIYSPYRTNSCMNQESLGSFAVQFGSISGPNPLLATYTEVNSYQLKYIYQTRNLVFITHTVFFKSLHVALPTSLPPGRIVQLSALSIRDLLLVLNNKVILSVCHMFRGWDYFVDFSRNQNFT